MADDRMTVEQACEIISSAVLHQNYVVDRAKGFLDAIDRVRQILQSAEELITHPAFLVGSASWLKLPRSLRVRAGNLEESLKLWSEIEGTVK